MDRTTLIIAGTPRTFFATADGKIFESVANGSCPEVGQWPPFAATCADAIRAILPEAHECAQCKRGEFKQSTSNGYFVGRIPTLRRNGALGWTPYRGWLCADHATMLCDDGAELRPTIGGI